ncbi:hypothetical protein [Sulfurimonas sp.]|uniref:hypothetical protein n=1 Tax=Sulfurimonas sp. TaxID=2022749 RepID=UPI003D0A6129
MYKLDEVKQYIEENIKGFFEYDKIEPLYNMISNPEKRVNDDDKKWVAYVTQASEDRTVVNAMKEILEIEEVDWILTEKKKVIEAVDKVGEIFINLDIEMKPRIPFYVLVLNELVE